VSRLHRLPNHVHQFAVQCLKVRLVPELHGEGFEGLPGVVLSPVEATVYERLDASPQGREQGRYKEGGGDDCEGGLLSGE
jgi:hypothetical protein